MKEAGLSGQAVLERKQDWKVPRTLGNKSANALDSDFHSIYFTQSSIARLPGLRVRPAGTSKLTPIACGG